MTTPSTSPTASTSVATTGTDHRTTHRDHDLHVRRSTETKQAFKTTEFLAYLGCVAGIIIMSLLVGDDTGANDRQDYFLADKAMLLITAVTIGYLLSRGLAKAGSREPYDDTVGRDHR